MSQIHDSWTCARSLDGTLVQIDFLLADTRVVLLQTWNDFSLAIGLRPSLGALQSEMRQPLLPTEMCEDYIERVETSLQPLPATNIMNFVAVTE